MQAYKKANMHKNAQLRYKLACTLLGCCNSSRRVKACWEPSYQLTSSWASLNGLAPYNSILCKYQFFFILHQHPLRSSLNWLAPYNSILWNIKTTPIMFFIKWACSLLFHTMKDQFFFILHQHSTPIMFFIKWACSVQFHTVKHHICSIMHQHMLCSSLRGYLIINQVLKIIMISDFKCDYIV